MVMQMWQCSCQARDHLLVHGDDKVVMMMMMMMMCPWCSRRRRSGGWAQGSWCCR
jgi:hypothetical protein